MRICLQIEELGFTALRRILHLSGRSVIGQQEFVMAFDNPGLVKELRSLLNEWYVPSERQAGKFVPIAPKRKRK